jgi:23S rRNA-/tRNA-specific pseudouridylate synthase
MKSLQSNVDDAHTVEEPNNVALVWKYNTSAAISASATTHRGKICVREEPYIYVSLQPITNETLITTPTTPSTESKDSDPTSVRLDGAVSTSVSHLCHNDDTVNDTQINAHTCNNNVTDTDIIPDSVLIYERQLRKVQHAKKTSQPLSDSDLRVIYVDEHIVVINKPAGVLTVPGVNGNPSILDLVYEKYGVGTVTDPVHMIVHRLDMDTSGILVFARSLSIAKQLHAVFRDRLHVSKQYECLVMGHLVVPSDINHNTKMSVSSGSSVASEAAASKILIDLPIQRDHVHPPFMRISTPQSEKAAMECVDQLQRHGWKKIMRKAAKPSQTIVLQILEYGFYNSNDKNHESNDSNGIPSVVTNNQQQESSLPYTRLRLEPITGRTHQLRVHW